MTDEPDVAARLAELDDHYRLVTENCDAVVCTMDADGTITFLSPAVERLRGFPVDEATAQGLHQVHPPESAAHVADYLERVRAARDEGTEPPRFEAELEYYRKDGSILVGESTIIPELAADGTLIRLVGVVRDISERRRFEAELGRMSVIDPLTGAWNQRHGQTLFLADVATSRRYGPALSLLMVDIDDFTRINEDQGHQAGDQVLLEVAQRLKANLRASDVLVRWGGARFVVLMRHSTALGAGQLAEKLRALVAHQPFDALGTVTISVGAAELEPDDDLASWLERAGRAMDEAKSAGGNAVRPVMSSY